MKRDFNTWLSSFRDSISDYRYYVDFNKVYQNVDSIKIELNILNSLIHSKNIEQDFKNILERYPEVLKCIPILIAVRLNEIHILDNSINYIYDFRERNHSIDEYTTFIADTYGLHIANVENSNNFIVSHIYNDYSFNSDFKITYYTNLGNMNLNSLSISYKDLFNAYKNKDQLTIDFSIYPDSDNDGVPDFAEINMDLISFDNDGKIILPSFKDCCYYSSNNSGYEWFKEQLNSLYGEDFFQNNMLSIVPTLSNPVLVDSDGDGLLDIDDPYPNEKFDDRFLLVDDFDYIPTVDFVEQHFVYGQKCYNTKDISANEYLKLLFGNAIFLGGYTTCFASLLFQREQIKNYSYLPFTNTSPNFSKFLECYITSQPITVKILNQNNMEEIIYSQKTNIEHYSYNINQLKLTAEQVVNKNNNIDNPKYISSNSNNNFKTTCYKGNFCSSHNDMNFWDNNISADWGFAIGESLGGMVGEVYCVGDTYFMNIKYYLIDTYEFPVHWSEADKNDKLSNIFHDLHECGEACEYKILGIYEDTVSWKSGDILYPENYVDINIEVGEYSSEPLY